jgi:thiamine biosynthesis lipoprotein
MFRRSGPLLLVVLLGACSGDSDSDYRRFGGNTMGTYYQVTARCPTNVAPLIEQELETVNAEMSTYLPDSVLSRFNQAAPGGWFEVPPALAEVVVAAQSLSVESAGAFDVTVGPLVNLWGFGPEDPGDLPGNAAIEDTLERVGLGYLSVRREPPALRKMRALYVALSAIAKGHGVDRVAGRLAEAGCSAMLVDIGGEVRGMGASPSHRSWRIGVEVPDPASLGAVQRIVALGDLAIATSGDYRNFREAGGQRFSHTIDPRTGYPVEHDLASVSVLHPSAMWADGYATLLNVLGPEAGLQFARRHDLAALFVVRGENGFEERYTAAFEAAVVE